MPPIKQLLSLTTLLLALAFLVGCDAFDAPAAPSAATVTVQAAPVEVSGAASPTVAEASPTTDPYAAASPTAATAAEASPTTASAAPAATTTFHLVPGESSAQFTLDETLRGQLTTVVGTTTDVNGDIVVDFANPAATQISEISVNARTLATDNSNRNRAIANFILQSDAFEFITFKPTAINGLSGPVTIGQPVAFEMVGDLTIRDQTKPATFQVTVTPVSETRLEGTATTTVNRGDFGLTIPSVPFVADVEEQVEITLTFVATP